MSSPGERALRLGVFGGSFDPPHAAHVALAHAAVEQLQLDRLLIIPTGFAWHKARTLTDAAHRLVMCERAFSQVKGAVIDARETLRSGPTYTADTLQELKTQYPGAQIFLVLGEDQARLLSSWHRADEVLDNAIICVALRPASERLAGDPPSKILEIPGMRRLSMPPSSASATEIRQTIAQGTSQPALVFDSVASYIAQHHLYQSDR